MDLIRRRQLGLTFIWSLHALRALPGGLAGRVGNGRCEATCVVSNLGRALADCPLPARGGKLVAGNLLLEGVEFFGPVREGTAAILALVFYAGELHICLRYDSRRITAAQADDLLTTYLQTVRASLGELSPHAATKRPEFTRGRRTLESLAQLLALVVGGLVAVQAALLIGYVCFLCRVRRPLLADGDCPRAAVILCVRGLDPFLAASVKGLLRQDYPRYDVWIVVDSVRDPAWPVVNSLVHQFGRGNVRVLTLTDRLATSTRKVAGQLQALAQLDTAHEIVAVLDADAIPHATWLRELAAPLLDPRVGVASGNRWYMPAATNCGSLVRYLWNAAAVVQMYWYGMGWGGSLAFKIKLLREADLGNCLANAFADDIATCRCARRNGYRVRFVPSLVMVNRETCSVKGLFGFLERQLLCVRLHDPWWWAVVAHGVGTTAALALCGLAGAAATATADWGAAVRLGASLAAYWISMAAMLVPLEWSARRIVRSARRIVLPAWDSEGYCAGAHDPLGSIRTIRRDRKRDVRPPPLLARRPLPISRRLSGTSRGGHRGSGVMGGIAPISALTERAA